jgi:hypothetical protein
MKDTRRNLWVRGEARLVLHSAFRVLRLKSGRSTGIEPATFGSTIQCSNQLSYDRHKMLNITQSGGYSSKGNGVSRAKG